MGSRKRLSHGGAELRRRALAFSQTNGAWTTAAAPPVDRFSATLVRRHLLRRSQRSARIRADAFDHGSKAVGTLRCEMLSQPEAIECRNGIGCKDLARMPTGKHRE